MKVITLNKKATYEYFIEDRFEAGIELTGNEVKSIRLGNVNLKDSFVFIRNGQMTLKNMHISPYEKGSYNNLEATRDRKLLMHKNEILKLFGKVQEKGYTVIPTKLYFKDSLIKVEISLCKGKELFDKRKTIKERDQKRDIERALKEYNK